MAKNVNSRPSLIKKVLSEQIKEQLMEDLLNKKYKAGDRLVRERYSERIQCQSGTGQRGNQEPC